MKRSLTQLAKAVGCSSLDPIPPDQYLWMQNAGEPPLYRLWSWMVYQTMHWGRDSAYAVSADGDEMHIENAADNLEMDVSNVYRTWREGQIRGLWRNGTRAEGVRRLYLNGKVKALKGEEEANTIVCTDNCKDGLPPHLMALPPYLVEQIQLLTPERRQEASIRYARHLRVRKDVQADLVAATRMVLDEDEDNLWREFAIEKNRQKHATKAPAEEVEERRQRIAAILPTVQQYVQTVQTFVQSEKTELYSTAYNGESTNASLLMLNTSRRGQTVSRHEVSAVADAGAPNKPLSKRAKSSYTRSEQPSEPEPDRKIDPETQEGLKLLAGQLEQMQKAYKHTDFGLSDFDPNSKPGQLFLLRVVTAIGGPGQVMSFCLHVITRFKGLDRNALGKLPSRAPNMSGGPRGLGLILLWAQDFGRSRAAAGGGDR